MFIFRSSAVILNSILILLQKHFENENIEYVNIS